MAETFRNGRYQLKRKHDIAMQILPSDMKKQLKIEYLHFGCGMSTLKGEDYFVEQ